MAVNLIFFMEYRVRSKSGVNDSKININIDLLKEFFSIFSFEKVVIIDFEAISSFNNKNNLKESFKEKVNIKELTDIPVSVSIIKIENNKKHPMKNFQFLSNVILDEGESNFESEINKLKNFLINEIGEDYKPVLWGFELESRMFLNIVNTMKISKKAKENMLNFIDIQWLFSPKYWENSSMPISIKTNFNNRKNINERYKQRNLQNLLEKISKFRFDYYHDVDDEMHNNFSLDSIYHIIYSLSSDQFLDEDMEKSHISLFNKINRSFVSENKNSSFRSKVVDEMIKYNNEDVESIEYILEWIKFIVRQNG